MDLKATNSAYVGDSIVQDLNAKFAKFSNSAYVSPGGVPPTCEIYTLPHPVGYWQVDEGAYRIECRKRPRWVVRQMARMLLDFVWCDYPEPR